MMTPRRLIRHRPSIGISGIIRRLRRNQSGLALTEFALSLPIFVGLGMYGTELAYLAVVNMQMSQAALTLADNASRLGQTQNNVTSVAIKESDIITVFNGLKLQGQTFDLLSNGRVILTSLERNPTGGQWIHWQRCLGTMKVKSDYGDEGTGLIGTSFPGMGRAGQEVTALSGTAVMFVELNYKYKGLFGDLFVKDKILNQQAAHNIRDNRNLTVGLIDDAPLKELYCTKYTAG